MVVAALCLGACTLTSSMGPAAQQVQLEGQTYQISQLTDSTWIAVPTDTGKLLALSASGRSALLGAIASTSGCKVTNSDYSRRGTQLDAQVDCGSRLDHPGPASRQDSDPQAGQRSTP